LQSDATDGGTKLGVERPAIEAQRSAMPPAGVPLLPLIGRASRFFACRATCSLTLGWMAGHVSAQETPAKAPEFSLSFQERKAAEAAYVGDETCSACHQDKAASYHRTAHAHTSSLASGESIHGNFNAGSNILRTVNPNLYFQMEAKGGVFTQTAVMRTSETKVMTRTEQIDIVVGSGRKGQTYLYWDDKILQLPVSYWTGLGDWVNSPGYRDGTANFDRPIGPRCFECHGSRFESRAPPENRFERASLVLGISCEKCHGPGGEHVARFRSATPPRSPAEMAIVNPARLPRDRQMDVCALCHGGSGESIRPALSFMPGDTLDQFLILPSTPPNTRADVHAIQIQLLQKSRCFQSSASMSCNTCHDVHQPQRDADAFVSRCLTCHQVASCRQFPKLGHAIDGKCVDCHMPLQQTEKIISSLNGRKVQPMVRNHQIAIYPDVRLP
jgi:hypothetical protein